MARVEAMNGWETGVLTLDSINPNVIHIEYAVRGPIVQKACLLEKEISQGVCKKFREIVKCNIGDCHATGQKPITFFRQVISMMTYPTLIDDPKIPSDAKLRAKRMLTSCSGSSVGSYSDSLGLWTVREDVARFIERRDGISSAPENIFLSSGASEAIKSVLYLLSTGLAGDQRAGIMVPVPQYPLYSATNSEYNAYQINYYLDESRNWALNTDELERALNEAKGKCLPRAIVVINPGNPTGQVLSRESMEQVIKFAVDNRLVLLADEVYQFNIYHPDEHPWFSFKRVLHDMGPAYSQRLELASFMSCSKGFMGECGFRGGYCELVNFNPDVQAQLYKLLSARLCSPVLGQAMVGCFVNPPEKHEPSYNSYTSERDSILGQLKLKAEMMTKMLNSLPGMSCNVVQGAMYAFPRIHLPPRAVQAAEERGLKPDFFYCVQFLEEKGVCFVPGSGFGQVDGTYHFRVTILPPVEKIKHVLECLKDFHTAFMAKYSDTECS
ncbi:Glutamic--pyruvic transaminase [Paragonimus heterotremus]|uniref:alanine transaminase n=1 Tax=Paragonimus heterotremus TaxID=100268 RepID=A0A8J4SWU3_9TREM|nr:Glutamic--pyruvic transaminase [Paragonimus heterotremus]